MRIDMIPAFKAYEEAINLTLYHAFAELVMQTSQDDKVRSVYCRLEAVQIWQLNMDVSTYFEAYNLRYPGEVLERFEEKLGADIRNVRALALALAYTRSIQAEDMFVGNQRSSFLQKLRREAGEDVYVKGALCLLETDAQRQRSLQAELAETEYGRTEEAVFVLSLFDDREEGYRTMRPQLIRLFGQGRTFPLECNFGVLEWLIRFYAGEVKSYRGKQDLALRTLMKLPYMNMKPGSREYEILTGTGCRQEEVTLANSLAVWADRIPDRLSPNGIPGEKIAAACCTVVLNRSDPMPELFYDYTGWLLNRYRDLNIKYEGFPSLWVAIQENLKPTAPRTILWMKQTIKKEFPYRFDVFDPQYDLLAEKLEHADYMELFTEQMLFSRKRIPLKQWLARFRTLTGADYITEYFSEHQYHDERVFALMVERKEIDLWQFFEQHRTNGKDSPPLDILRRYAMRVSSWRCFRFVQRLLSQYTFPQLQEIFGHRFCFHDSFFRNKGYYHNDYIISLERPFISVEQRRQLFTWIDTSVFQTQPDKYEAFVRTSLKSPEIQRLYDKTQLALILKHLLKNGGSHDYEMNRLKELFYTKAELEADRKAANEKKAQAERQERERAILEKRERLTAIYDGSMSSLNKYARQYYGDGRKDALDMAYQKLLEWPAGCAETLAPEELETFFEFCGELVEYQPRTIQEILGMVRTMIGGAAA